MKIYLRVLYLLAGLCVLIFSGYNVWLLWHGFISLMLLTQLVAFVTGTMLLLFSFVSEANILSHISLSISVLYTLYYFSVLRLLEAYGGWPLKTIYIIIGADVFLTILALVILLISVSVSIKRKF